MNFPKFTLLPSAYSLDWKTSAVAMIVILMSLLCAYTQACFWESLISYLHQRKTAKYPLVVPKAANDWASALVEGRRTYPDTPFELPPVCSKKTVIIPARFIDEIKNLPEEKLSFRRDVIERLVGDYTMIGTHERSMIDAVRVDLTRNIPRLQPLLQDEAEHAVMSVFGPCTDWTSIQVFPKLLRIISLMSSRIFVGLPLSRNEEWIHAMSGYTEDAFRAGMKLWGYPPWMRPFIWRWLPELKAVNEHIKTAQRLIAPVLQERLKALKDPSFEAPPDMMQFLFATAGPKAKTKHFQAKHQILATFTAIHTTAMNACHAVFDLAAHPEFIRPLRKELETVLKEEGGVLTKVAMSKLKKLDSLFRETQRLNPNNLLGMGRKVTSTFALSDGSVLQGGTFIAVDAHSLYQDPVLYPNPSRFDAFRFARMREQPGCEHRYQAATTGPEHLAFGHGSHACPGRFFAVNETKVLLAYLILHFDWTFKDRKDRPANFWMDTMSAPDPTVEVLFKRR